MLLREKNLAGLHRVIIDYALTIKFVKNGFKDILVAGRTAWARCAYNPTTTLRLVVVCDARRT